MRLKTKGFTLIELLVVIAIIAILAILIIMALNAARARARDSSRKTDLRTVQTGLELAISDETLNHYPNQADDGWAAPGYASLDTWEQANDKMGFGVDGLPTDMNVQTVDYGYTSDGTDYALGAELESSTGNAECAVGSWEYCVGTDPDFAGMAQ